VDLPQASLMGQLIPSTVQMVDIHPKQLTFLYSLLPP
jgi:hypothetical protein